MSVPRPAPRLVGLAGAVTCAFLLSACSGSSAAAPEESTDAGSASSIELPEEYQGRPLVPIVLSNYAPLGYTDEDGTFTGFDYDFAMAIGEELGVEVDIVPNTWENGLLGIEGDKYDWTGSASITPEGSRSTT